MEYPNFKVCVRCFTFNQSKYITDTMNGFTMQQTDFPFVCCIVDDASKDGEQDVIRKYVFDNFDLSEGSCHFERETDYAFITYAQHKTNKNCYFAVLYLKENHYSIKKPKMPYLTEWQDGCEYHALCEGDDWWIDPLKLNKQVSFLDLHSDYIFSHTGFDFYEQERELMVSGDSIIQTNLELAKNKDDLSLEILDSNHYRVQTCTVVIRTGSGYDYARQEMSKISGMFLMGDSQLWVFLQQKGKIHFLKDKTAIYRKCQGSACRQQSDESRLRFQLSCEEMRVYMAVNLKLDSMYLLKFYRQYINRLMRYKWINNDYKPFIPLRFDNAFQKLVYQISTSNIVLPIIKPVYIFYIKYFL